MESGIYITPSYLSNPSSKRTTRSSRRRPAEIQPATIFTPQDDTLSPETHFPLQTVFAPDRPAFPRFINRFDSREMLLVVDGSCVNNGRNLYKDELPQGGVSFVFKGAASASASEAVTFPFLAPEEGDTPTGTVAFKLEPRGPGGQRVEATSNRAKLRAVIAALQFRPWDMEGWRRVVILTDLKYVVSGATVWMPRWVARKWRKPASRAKGAVREKDKVYSNRDLWEELQKRVDELRLKGCEVSFWLADGGEESRFIQQAKDAARAAARQVPEGQMVYFTRLCGIMV